MIIKFQLVQTKHFPGFLPNNTLSESYYQTTVNTSSEFISKITHTFKELLQTAYYTLFQTSDNNDIFREFLSN